MSTSTGHESTGPYPQRTRWDKVAGRALPARRLVLTAVVAAVAAWLVTGMRAEAQSVTQEFAFTGGRAQFVVPADVCRVRIEAAGASGGLQGTAGTPGLGARVSATIVVTPGETLVVHVGGQGGAAVGATPGRGGWNGGGNGGTATNAVAGRAGSGGGGAADVRRGAAMFQDRILVAGGGAGSGGGGIVGAYGMTGGDGGSDGVAPLGVANPTTGGRGGTLGAGGAPGANGPDSPVTAAGGSLGVGGNGANGAVNGGGGGGGGFYGGGGGGAELRKAVSSRGAGQGGGGSSFGPPDMRLRGGVWGNLGDGWVEITYDPDADGCAEADRPE